MPRPPLDAFDRRILAALQRDGRTTNAALAEAIGLSPTPCLRRVRRLEAEGAIEGYTARIDPAAVGLGLTAFVSVGVDTHSDDHRRAFEAAVAERPEITACWLVSGESDFLLQVTVADLDAYSRLLTDHLLRLPGVKDVRSAFALRTVKAPAGLPLGEG